MQGLVAFFKLEQFNTDIKTELKAGLTTFLTMAYILFVNPQLLSISGIPQQDIIFATCVASTIACFVMGIYGNFPLALAPGMGLNAYFTFGVVQGMGISWQVALAAVFVEGIIFLLLAFTGFRSKMINAIPNCLKIATMTGIGLFLAIIGFKNAGLTVAHPATLVTLGDLNSPSVLLSFFGIILTGALLFKALKAAILLSIVILTTIAWLTGLSPLPEQFIAWPALPSESLMAVDFSQVFSAAFVTVVVAFLFVDMFDTAGTLIGTGRAAGLLNEKGELPNSEKAFVADAIGTTSGALLGTSTVTTYVESATGIESGGRTGLTAITVGVLFLLALFFAPLFISIPALATAPALIVVGAMMMLGARDLDWMKMDESVPAFLTVVAMPFTFSIANGIALGIISYVLIKILTGQYKDLNLFMMVLAAALLAFHLIG
ncbi:NCS2 family permease [Catenovulum sp. SM1970]|uniref:NCS2 family permease n=1 Tax=Marinifaba aquimaris TaxID=2741323 RepID=UPI001573D7FE|nr:NCS2 family permease [Marinifaba aquimaris]NTS76024.1 NCS2 family permease [Marinifaba aquimaris]